MGRFAHLNNWKTDERIELNNRSQQLAMRCFNRSVLGIGADA